MAEAAVRTVPVKKAHEVKSETFIVRSWILVARGHSKPDDFVRIPTGATVALDWNFHDVQRLLDLGAICREGDPNSTRRLTGREIMQTGRTAAEVAHITKTEIGLVQLDDTVVAPSRIGGGNAVDVSV